MDEARLPVDILFDYLEIKINDDNSREYILKDNAPQDVKDFFKKWKKGSEKYREQDISLE